MYYYSQTQELATELKENTVFNFIDNTHYSAKYKEMSFTYECDAGKMFDNYFDIHIENEKNYMVEIQQALHYRYRVPYDMSQNAERVLLDIILFMFVDYRNYVYKHMLKNVVNYFNDSDWSYELQLVLGSELTIQLEEQDYGNIFQKLIERHIKENFKEKWCEISNYHW